MCLIGIHEDDILAASTHERTDDRPNRSSAEQGNAHISS
jgi:hypothetical protein